MTRSIAFALVAALTLVLSFNVVQPGPSKVGFSAAEAAAKQKVCKSKLPSGKMKTWRCGTDQACCVNHSMGLYVCGFAGLGCL